MWTLIAPNLSRVMASAAPTVSVIVPTYNGGDLVARCLDSLLTQRAETLEVIVVDDGSTDGTLDVVKRYPGVRVVRGDHHGVAAARSTGVARASAPFIGFCDQDDEWLPGKAHRQAKHLRSRSDVAAVLCRQDVVLDEVDRPVWLVDDRRGDAGGVLPLSGLFRTEVFNRLGGFVDSGLGSDDFDLLVRMREEGLCLDVLDDVLVRRHVHDNNASHALGSYAPGMIEVLRRRTRRARQ
jgi:glycosyltransferase involved in cell wall biosynthesis